MIFQIQYVHFHLTSALSVWTHLANGSILVIKVFRQFPEYFYIRNVLSIKNLYLPTFTLYQALTDINYASLKVYYYVIWNPYVMCIVYVWNNRLICKLRTKTLNDMHRAKIYIIWQNLTWHIYNIENFLIFFNYFINCQ